MTNGRQEIVYGTLVNAGTVAVGPGGRLQLSDGLAGRWADLEKVECGIHL